MKSVAVVAAAATFTMVQGATNTTSLCDKYTTALFTNDTAANQYALVSAVVNRAVIGNMSATPAVAGILATGTYMGESVNLLPYFNGQFNSSNRGGASGVSVNFLDGGGATPIEAGMPANDTTSNQYSLLTHLYEYFGSLLACSDYGMTGYPAYAGQASMYNVHKFMDLDQYEVGWFIEQVGLAAESFGVTTDDVTTIGNSLSAAFNVRCAPNTTIIAAQGAQQNSICIQSSCPLAANSTCSSYPSTNLMPTNVTMTNGTSTMSGSTGTSTSTASGTSTAPAMQTTNAGSAVMVSGALIAAALAFAL